MQNQSAIITGGTTSGGATENIKSRFGDITVDSSKALVFPRGLLGLPDKANFVLAQFPNAKMQQFALLQSLDEAMLSFITLPLDVENPIIAAADVKAACADMQIAQKDLALLLIVTVHRMPDQVKLSVNARAPILIDAERRVGVQYVFASDSYSVQHMLG